MPDREHAPSRLAAPAVLACLQLEALDMQSLLDGSDPVGIIVGLEHEDVGERARYATAQLLGSPVRISAKQVGELRSEHVRREQRVLLGTWRQPAECDFGFDPAHGRCQACAALVAAEQVAALGGSEPVVGVLGDPHLVPGQPRWPPGPRAVARDAGWCVVTCTPLPVPAGRRRGRVGAAVARDHARRARLLRPARGRREHAGASVAVVAWRVGVGGRHLWAERGWDVHGTLGRRLGRPAVNLRFVRRVRTGGGGGWTCEAGRNGSERCLARRRRQLQMLEPRRRWFPVSVDMVRRRRMSVGQYFEALPEVSPRSWLWLAGRRGGLVRQRLALLWRGGGAALSIAQRAR